MHRRMYQHEYVYTCKYCKINNDTQFLFIYFFQLSKNFNRYPGTCNSQPMWYLYSLKHSSGFSSPLPTHTTPCSSLFLPCPPPYSSVLSFLSTHSRAICLTRSCFFALPCFCSYFKYFLNTNCIFFELNFNVTNRSNN